MQNQKAARSRPSLPSQDRRTTYSGPEHVATGTVVAEAIAGNGLHRPSVASQSGEKPVFGRQQSVPGCFVGAHHNRKNSHSNSRGNSRSNSRHEGSSHSGQPWLARMAVGLHIPFKDTVATHLSELQQWLVEEYDHRQWRLERQAAMLSEENKILKDDLYVLYSNLTPDERLVQSPKLTSVRNLFTVTGAAVKMKTKVKEMRQRKGKEQESQEVDSQAKDSDPATDLGPIRTKKRLSRKQSLKRTRNESVLQDRRGTLRESAECSKVMAVKECRKGQAEPGSPRKAFDKEVTPVQELEPVNEVALPDMEPVNQVMPLQELETVNEENSGNGVNPDGTLEAWKPFPPSSVDVCCAPLEAPTTMHMPERVEEVMEETMSATSTGDAPVANEAADNPRRKSVVQFGQSMIKELSISSTNEAPSLPQLQPANTVSSDPSQVALVSPPRPQPEEKAAPRRVSIMPNEETTRHPRVSIMQHAPYQNGDRAAKHGMDLATMEEASNGQLSPDMIEEEDSSGDELWDGSDDEDDEDEDELFEVFEVWTTEYFEKFAYKDRVVRATTRGSRQSDAGDAGNGKASMHSAAIQTQTSVFWLDEKDTGNGWEGFMMRFVVHPTSWIRLIWDFFACVFILYDIVVIPLESFSPPENTFTRMMAWYSRIFWTFDIMMNFFTGYLEPHGMMELRPTKVAKRYAMSWLCVDLGTVLCEWAELFASGNARAWFRRIPWLRITRIVRLRRLMRSWEFINVTVSDELAFLMAGVLRNVLGILLLSHFVACCWYRLVRAGEGGEEQFAVEALPSMWSKYAWAFHWASMQFTGLGLHTQPHLDNPAQVIYSISSMFLTFVISASFVSVITTSMTRYHITNDQNLVQFAMLRKYLVDNNISARLSMRMQQNAHHVVAERDIHVPESQIELLELISDPLRVELHFELYVPHLSGAHPFFDLYTDKYPTAIRQVCHHTCSQASFFAGDLIFGDGEKPAFPRMFFILSGILEYVPCMDTTRKKELHKGSTISEAVLWTDWVHQGTLKVLTECRILALDAEKFQNIAVQFRVGNFFPPEIYARQFVESLNSAEGPLTDIVSAQLSALMVKRAFGTNEKRNKRAMSSYRQPSTSSVGEALGRHDSALRLTNFSNASGSIIGSIVSGFASLRNSGDSVLIGETSFENAHVCESVMPSVPTGDGRQTRAGDGESVRSVSPLESMPVAEGHANFRSSKQSRSSNQSRISGNRLSGNRHSGNRFSGKPSRVSFMP